MRKNVASQVIAAQLNSATDGSAVTTGTTTVYVLGDGGTQGAGSGTVTHEGNGCWSYVPTQAETNYDHVAFTFVNSAAIAQTVQAYPVAYDPSDAVRLGLSALPNAAADAAGGLPISDAGGLDLDAVLSGNTPQTGDSYARLGAPAGASVSADIAALNDISVADILTTAMTEAYAANGAAPTLAQALFAIHQMLMQFSISGTALTVKKLDNSTTAFTATLDSSSAPTSVVRV